MFESRKAAYNENSFKSDNYRCSTYDIRTSEDNRIRILP